MNNIVLFGGSNSILNNGLKTGLANNANVINLALGDSTAIQSLYELCRKRNKKAIENADLIVVESNLNEIAHHALDLYQLPLKLILRNLQWFYEKLYKIGKPVCIIILPCWLKNYTIINNMHRYFANLYGFNAIDMHNYYAKNNLVEFSRKTDWAHPMLIIMRKIGQNISKNISCFLRPKKSNHYISKLPTFKIITPNQMKKHGIFKIFNPKNYMYAEKTFRLDNSNYLSIKKKYNGYHIIGIHAWNLQENGVLKKEDWKIRAVHRSLITIGNKKTQVRKCMARQNHFCEIQAKLIIDNGFTVKYNNKYITNTEFFILKDWYKDAIYSSHFDIVSLFLCSNYNQNSIVELDKIPNNKEVKLNPKIDFTNLIPNINKYNDYMKFIDKYISQLNIDNKNFYNDYKDFLNEYLDFLEQK